MMPTTAVTKMMKRMPRERYLMMMTMKILVHITIEILKMKRRMRRRLSLLIVRVKTTPTTQITNSKILRTNRTKKKRMTAVMKKTSKSKVQKKN